MPKLTKKALSLYLRNNCERQLRLALYSDRELRAAGMPPRQASRPGLGFAAQAGDEYQKAKVDDLIAAFGSHVTVGPTTRSNPFKLEPVDLLVALGVARHYELIIEAEFKIPPTFEVLHGLDTLRDDQGEPVVTGHVRPDLVQVLPPVASGKLAFSRGLDGRGQVIPLLPGDGRQRLRIIDIKLSSQPGANYFGEVAFYSMALAAWLAEHGLEDRFVVVPSPAIWPGSYEDSALKRILDAASSTGTLAPVQVLLEALEEDFETVEYSLFAPAIERFLHRDLPRMLRTPWANLAWHANFRCMGCEFFGHDWTDAAGRLTNHTLHCAPTAERGRHLSRVVGLNRGQALTLARAGVTTVDALAVLPPTSPVLDANHALQMKRTLLPARAQALTHGRAFLATQTGASAVLPAFVNLRILIDLEYDPTTAITGALALRATWDQPVPFGVTLPEEERVRRSWGYDLKNRLVYVVDRKDLDLEREQFLAFLTQLKTILDEVQTDDAWRLQARPHGVKESPSTYQIFLWDSAQLKHLSRLVSRHLPAVLDTPGLEDLAWLFPSPELLKRSEDATRTSPISLVAPAVEAYVALPLAHHFTVLDVAQHYRKSLLTPSYYRAGQHFHDRLSNLIPPERIHEMWQATRDPARYAAQYGWVRDRLEIVAHRKTVALHDITNQLTKDLKDRGLLVSGAAPTVGTAYERLDGVANESQLLYQYHRLNAATQRLESETTYALPVHERVGKFKAARLGAPLLTSTSQKQRILKLINAACQTTLDVRDTGLLLFPLPPESRNVNFRAGDIGLHLSPASDPVFLHRKVVALPNCQRAERFGWITSRQKFRTVADSGLFEVTVLAVDRVNGYLVVRPHSPDFERLALCVNFNYRQGAMLDRIGQDFLASKLKVTLRAIGAPAVVPATPGALSVIAGSARGASRGATALTPTPATEFLWDSARTHTQIRSRAAAGLQAQLQASGLYLNDSQWQAFEHALTRRLTVMWGPPGTGKSQTIRAIIRGAVLEAEQSGRPLRLLVTSNTYTAVDNVLLKVVEELEQAGSNAHIYRVQSNKRPIDDNVEQLERTHASHFTNVVLNRMEAPTALDTQALLTELTTPYRPIIIGAPAQQLHNLAYAGGLDGRIPQHAQRSWFDLTIIDEASQLDVATSTIVFTKAAPLSACLLAGDDLQLPPIHPVEKPEGFKDQLGSLYEYMTRAQGVESVNLEVNYRSNEEIVAATRLTGYPKLESHSKGMRLNMLSWPPPATHPPTGWPAHLHWTPAWLTLLEPDQPVTCVVYDDEISGQSNDFEADAIAALLWLARRHLADAPVGKLRADGTVTSSIHNCDDRYFWEKGVGVVTPHKAQVSRVSEGLLRTFPGGSANAIRAAVDTVERFQGQERQIIIASFGVGDPDIISDEDGFLYDIRRFNVMVSRAETKLIVFLTRTFLNHLSNDKDVLDQSSLVKRFAEAFCHSVGPLVLGHLDRNGAVRVVEGELRQP